VAPSIHGKPIPLFIRDRLVYFGGLHVTIGICRAPRMRAFMMQLYDEVGTTA